MVGQRIVVPKRLRADVLSTAHLGHPGISRMKEVAQANIYWPNINADIETYVKTCKGCQEAGKSAVKVELHSWPVCSRSFERVHVDLAGPKEGLNYMVLQDAFSKWPETFIMSSTTTSSVLEKLQEVFGRFGYPEQLVTDNGSQFTSDPFKDYCDEKGIICYR